jgi:hypothetical protein
VFELQVENTYTDKKGSIEETKEHIEPFWSLPCRNYRMHLLQNVSVSTWTYFSYWWMPSIQIRLQSSWLWLLMERGEARFIWPSRQLSIRGIERISTQAATDREIIERRYLEAF